MHIQRISIYDEYAICINVNHQMRYENYPISYKGGARPSFIAENNTHTIVMNSYCLFPARII